MAKGHWPVALRALALFFALLLTGCRPQTETVALSPTSTPPQATLTPTLVLTQPLPTLTEALYPLPATSIAAAHTATPPASAAASVTPSSVLLPYPPPAPGFSHPPYPPPPPAPALTGSPYPEPRPSNTPRRTTTPAGAPTATASPLTSTPANLPTGTPFSTPALTATERPPQPIGTPPAPGSTVSIWLSWDEPRRQTLETIIRSFQDLYPDVRFDILYVPLDELRGRYEAAAYYGRGPTLLFAPAEWGPALYESGLITDLTPYTAEPFLQGFLEPALGTVRYRGALIGLPYALRGAVLYRNTALIPDPPQTFDELIVSARLASRGGNLGAFLERGAYFSVPHLAGLGGRLMDENGDPAFNDAFGLAWLDLLAAFRQPGIAPAFNTNQDVELFRDGRIGFIIDGTWNREVLAQAIEPENLAIDPWPVWDGGRLSGYVQADCLYLNANARGETQYAALLFMGYLIDGQVQTLLAEVGYIPSVKAAQPRNEHIQQTMVALSGGIPYPPMTDYRYLSAYWDALENALRQVFEQGGEPAAALQAAYDAVLQRLAVLRSGAP